MKRYSEGEVLDKLRNRFQPRQGQTQAQTAAKLGFTPAYIHALLARSRPLTPEVARALGFRRVEYYVAIEEGADG